MRPKHILRPAIIAGLLLLIPLWGIYNVDGWNWTGFDFVFAFVLIFGAGFTFELVASRSSNIVYKSAVGLGILSAFIFLWVNAATSGIIGDGDLDSPNALYLLVILGAFVGAFCVKFKPKPMSRVMFAMAAAHMAVPTIAIILWPPPATSWEPGVAHAFVLTAVFAALFAGSGLLFWKAGTKGQGDS